LLEQGLTREAIAERVLAGLSPEKLDEKMFRYHCNCQKERFIRAIRGLSKQELEEILAEDKPITVECHFCDKKYEIRPEELKG